MGFHWVWFQPKEAWKYMTALLNVQVRCLPSTISSSVALCLRFLKKISNFSAHYLTNSRLPSPTNVGQWCPRQTPSLWDFSSHHALWTIHQICYQPWSFSGLRLCFRVHIANSWLLEGWLCVLHSKARWAWSDWDQVHHLDHLDLHGLLGIFRQLPACNKLLMMKFCKGEIQDNFLHGWSSPTSLAGWWTSHIFIIFQKCSQPTGIDSGSISTSFFGNGTSSAASVVEWDSPISTVISFPPYPIDTASSASMASSGIVCSLKKLLL